MVAWFIETKDFHSGVPDDISLGEQPCFVSESFEILYYPYLYCDIPKDMTEN
jgi:hypothetical protein